MEAFLRPDEDVLVDAEYVADMSAAREQNATTVLVMPSTTTNPLRFSTHNAHAPLLGRWMSGDVSPPDGAQAVSCSFSPDGRHAVCGTQPAASCTS